MPEHHDQLARIDRQLARLWALYRRWCDNGPSANTGRKDYLSPLEALEAIDNLLETRHQLVTGRQGELTGAQDIADAAEWGGADTGQHDQGQAA